jgi:hypothetical protein
LHPSTAPLADGAFSDILVITGDTQLHAFTQTKAVGTMEIYGYANTVVSANGAEITPVNRNPLAAAQMGYTPKSKFYHTPTITNVGDLIFTDMVPAGGTQGNQSSGAASGFEEGFIFPPNIQLLLRVKNVSGAAAIMHETITCHEDA